MSKQSPSRILGRLLAVAAVACVFACSDAHDDATRSRQNDALGAATTPPGSTDARPQAGAIAPSTPDASAGHAAPSAGGAGRNASTEIAGRGAGDTQAAGAGGAAADDPMRSRAFGTYDPMHPPQALALTGMLRVHDPAIIQSAGVYYVFGTGTNVPMLRSDDLLHWEDAGTAFSSPPEWMADSDIAFDPDNSMWAPDVSFFGGTHHLYYSVSSFGTSHSCIGHAIRNALDTGSWSDRGTVLCSKGQDYNAIDPNVVVDGDGVAWLAFGSFWSGIKLARLLPSGERADDALLAIAGGRPDPNAIEAPFIVRRGDFYYLFVSLDSCCQGTRSTYKLAVGRAASVRGPYLDKAGKRMLDGGGTVLLRGSEGDLTDDIPYAALGHSAVLIEGDDAFNVYHAYRESDGASVLRVAQLVWDEAGWPLSGGP